MVPRQRGTRPLFSAAELVPFFEDRTLDGKVAIRLASNPKNVFQEPAPRLTPLLEEGCGVDTEADPWDLLGAPNMVTTMMVLEGLATCAVFVDGLMVLLLPLRISLI